MAFSETSTITIASRDSLLALTQTVEAALRLEGAGFRVKVVPLKTAGDLKLDAPLYQDAAKNNAKEGRAFFTRELDEALLTGRADAAVHSYKDVPAESISGISMPIFFSQAATGDLLIARGMHRAPIALQKFTIGTSSLRRIHQLGLLAPQARTETLRGNIVTRLKRLVEGERGIDAIVLAAAGIQRVQTFAALDVNRYAHLFDEKTRARIAEQLAEFKLYLDGEISIEALDERDFPTAPGQGVLAFQLSSEADARFGERVRTVFAEHESITKRVLIERAVMTGLQAGCHAPLGVSAKSIAANRFEVSLCFSRTSSANPVAFGDSVFLHRTLENNANSLIDEVRNPIAQIFWWGFSPFDRRGDTRIRFIRAVQQTKIAAALPQDKSYASVFIASAATLDWLGEHPQLYALPFFAAGPESAAALQAKFPQIQVAAAGRGFKGALAHLLYPALWLGSLSGESRARKIAAQRDIAFCPVYDNQPLPSEEVTRQLNSGMDLGDARAMHALTSASAARCFLSTLGEKAHALRISCFGESAYEQLAQHGILAYHTSRAEDFESYFLEIIGDTKTFRREDT